MKIDYVNALAGSGKTYAIAKWANSAALAGKKILLVQPTAVLIRETISTTFPAIGATAVITRITADTHPDKVVTGIIAHMQATPADLGEILIITHAAFVLLSQQYVHGRSNWTVIVDEVLEIQTSYALNLPNTHEMLTKHLEVREATDTEYWILGKKEGSTTLDAIAKNEHRDDVYKTFFQQFAACVLSPDWQVYVKADKYMTMVAEVDVPGIDRQLNASAVLLPTIFKGYRRIIMMSACFTESLLYILWSRLSNIEVEFTDITSRFELRYLEHVNGDRLDIYYAVDGSWSKAARSREAKTVNGDQVEVFDAIRQAANNLIGNAPKAYLYNNDVGNETDDAAERLPAYSHGLNTYQHLNNAVLMIAINPPPSHFGFLRKIADVDPEDIKTAMNRACVYQAAMRTSLRDPSNLQPKTLVVPDRATAEWLSGLFKGSRVHDLGIFARSATRTSIGTREPGQPHPLRIHETNADRQRAYRERKAHEAPVKLDRALRVSLVNGYQITNRECLRAEALAASMVEMENIANTTIDRATFHGTLHANNVEQARLIAPEMASFDDLVSLFREASAEQHASKADCLLWSPSLFVERTDARSKRGYVNIAYCRHVVLDNDGGDLTPAQFAMFFPGLRMAIYSTWSSSAAVPKWRALIPTDCLVDIEGYKTITDHIIRTVKSKGYHSTSDFQKDPTLLRGTAGTHGFDVSKLNPSNILFLPSKGANPEAAFFIDMAGGNRGPIPVFEWLEAAHVSPPLPPVPVEAPPALQVNPKASESLQRIQAALQADDAIRLKRSVEDRAAKALDWWRVEGDVPGGRDSGFMRLASKLKFAGCEEAEFKDAMRQAAMCSRGDQKELRSKIGRLWRTVNKGGF